ncbi:CbbBc protein, partial [Klebsiella pneumoniae]|nr:CbbBc protein [Klebsiella pneumoniae]
FHVHAIPTDTAVHRAKAVASGEGLAGMVFTLPTVRSHDQYNTTGYGLDDRYRGVFGQRRVLFIHAEDRARLGLPEGAWVDLVGAA